MLGPDHPHTLAADVNQAVCLAEEGEWDSARERLRETAGRLATVIGAEHPDTLRCLGDLALVSRRAGGEAPAEDVGVGGGPAGRGDRPGASDGADPA